MHSFIYLIPIILKSISTVGSFMCVQYLTHTLLVLKLDVQIQQKTAWFESDFCVNSVSYIDTLLKIDNGPSLPEIFC